MKYRHYTDGFGKVIATSTYAGKTVRGVAKCSDRDEFDMESGVKLAEARCNARIAVKRAANAQRLYDIAVEELARAQARVDAMAQYRIDADAAVIKANEDVTSVLSTL